GFTDADHAGASRPLRQTKLEFLQSRRIADRISLDGAVPEVLNVTGNAKLLCPSLGKEPIADSLNSSGDHKLLSGFLRYFVHGSRSCRQRHPETMKQPCHSERSEESCSGPFFWNPLRSRAGFLAPLGMTAHFQTSR